MMVSRLFLIMVGLLYAVSSFAVASLTIGDGSEQLEEGRVYNVHFEYIQTEGVDDFGDLAYNPTFFSNIMLPIGDSVNCSFRSGAALVSLKRVSATRVSVSTNKGTSELSLPMEANRLAIGLRDADLCIWANADTSAQPTLTLTGFQRKEGKVSYSFSEGCALSETRIHYDYAYGLRFKFAVPEGTTVNDVEKTHDQRVVFNYQKTTQPPMLFLSGLSDDGKFIYCDLQPTPLNRPIPYGTVYTFDFKMAVNKCDPILSTRVYVELYNHPDNEVFFEQSCPCGENSCELDTVSISVDSYCANGDATLTANVNIDGRDCYSVWKRNSMNYEVVDGSNELKVSQDADYQVIITDKNDPSCVVSSPVFSLKRYTQPHVKLEEHFSSSGTVRLAPSVLNENGFGYLWNTGENSKDILASEPGHYSLTVSNGLCEVVVATIVDESPDEYRFPMVLTPNGDGINDRFSVQFVQENYPEAVISIYDRNGKKLTEYFGGEEGWDGTYMGNPVPSTDYWYKVDVETLDRTFCGHFTLVRDKR